MINKSRFYLGVFCVSAILMTLQILQSRIFSVTTWYHLSFLVISVAMFGLTLGALKVYRSDEVYQRGHCGELMGAASRKLGVLIFIGLLAQMFVPLITFTPFLFIVTLSLLILLTVGAYYQAGVALSLAITRSPFPVNQVYGFDLIGAAMGCLFVLGLMNFIDTPSAVLLLCVLCFVSAQCFDNIFQPAVTEESKRSRRLQKIVFLPIAALFGVNLFISPLMFPHWVKEKFNVASDFTYDEWNSISRVTIGHEETDKPPYLWGGSDKLPPDLRVPFYELKMDGDAATPINKFELGKTNLSYLDYDVTTLAYSLPGLNEAGIIGVGGGRDVLSAHHAGIKRITAMDVNRVQISVLSQMEPYRSYAGLHEIPDLKLVHSEARSWFTHSKDSFDLIQMSLIDTWAATGAGAFTLTENGLYTVEGWKVFLSHLKPHGVFTVSRWYFKDARSETERVLSLAVASLLDLGVEKPTDHIYMAVSGRISTFIVCRDPFTEAQLDALDARAKKMDFKTIISPRIAVEDPEWLSLANAKSRAELDEVASKALFDVSAATDHRPFFFNQVRVNNPAHVLSILSQGTEGSRIGNARAILNLYIILSIALVMVSAVILYPLRGALKTETPRLVTGGTIWFMLIGLGFMFIEISLIQRMGVYLGHPSYGLGIILFSLVLSTGFGSLLSGCIKLDNFLSRLIWIALTAASVWYGITMIDVMVERFADADLPARAALSVAVTMPIGLLLGFGFPTGMKLVGEQSRATPWFWGINGAAGVLGSVLSMFINLPFGLNTTMAAGGLCYALLIIPALLLSGRDRTAA